eukprot:403343919
MKSTLLVLSTLCIASASSYYSHRIYKGEEKEEMHPERYEEFDYVGGKSRSIVQNDKWPEVIWPNNAEMAMTVFQYNHHTKDLTPYLDMLIKQYVDADGGRSLSQVSKIDPKFGKVMENHFWDFDEQLLVVSDPEHPEKCLETDLEYELNLHELMERMKSPDGGITKYLGEMQVDWEKDRIKPATYHVFDLKFQWFHVKSEINIFFNIETKKLAWIQMHSPLLLVIQIEDGMKERKFTDEDFKDVLTECPEKLLPQEQMQ